jgi:predicted nucleic acid-binding protein
VRRFVLDASMTLAWLIDRSVTPYAATVRRLLNQGGQAVVPTLWQWEVANGFVIAERRGLLSSSETAQILHSFETVLVSIEIKQDLSPIHRTIRSAAEHRLTAYDAAYLQLAKDEQLPIATLDRALARAAAAAALPLLQ